MESPRIGSSQVAVLEDAQPLDFFDVSKNSWELRVSTEEIITERFGEIPDIAFCAVLLVCLSKALAFLKISSGSKTGVVAPFHTPRSCGRNIQATQCVLGGKFRVKAVTLFLTPPFRPTFNRSQGG